MNGHRAASARTGPAWRNGREPPTVLSARKKRTQRPLPAVDGARASQAGHHSARLGAWTRRHADAGVRSGRARNGAHARRSAIVGPPGRHVVARLPTDPGLQLGRRSPPAAEEAPGGADPGRLLRPAVPGHAPEGLGRRRQSDRRGRCSARQGRRLLQGPAQHAAGAQPSAHDQRVLARGLLRPGRHRHGRVWSLPGGPARVPVRLGRVRRGVGVPQRRDLRRRLRHRAAGEVRARRRSRPGGARRARLRLPVPPARRAPPGSGRSSARCASRTRRT
jgi:hypothetical protein